MGVYVFDLLIFNMGLCFLIGDGQFYNYKLKEGQLSDEKRSFLGKMPISLGTFSSNGTTHVFAASDKPSVIHSRNQKLIYSNVNLKVKNIYNITYIRTYIQIALLPSLKL